MLDNIANGGALDRIDCQHLADKIWHARVFDVFGRLVDAAFDLKNEYLKFWQMFWNGKYLRSQ